MAGENHVPADAVWQRIQAMRDALVAGGDQTIYYYYNYYVAVNSRNDAQNSTAELAGRLLDNAIQAASTLTGERKAEALAVIIPAANLVAPWRVGELASDADAAARSVEDARSRSAALAAVAGLVAAVNPEQAGAIALSVEDASQRIGALVALVHLLAGGGPPTATALRSSASLPRVPNDR